MKYELKPCPFCGAKARYEKRSGVVGITRSRWHRETVRCQSGCVITPEKKRPGLAVKVWNTRKPCEVRIIEDE